MFFGRRAFIEVDHLDILVIVHWLQLLLLFLVLNYSDSQLMTSKQIVNHTEASAMEVGAISRFFVFVNNAGFLYLPQSLQDRKSVV